MELAIDIAAAVLLFVLGYVGGSLLLAGVVCVCGIVHVCRRGRVKRVHRQAGERRKWLRIKPRNPKPAVAKWHAWDHELDAGPPSTEPAARPRAGADRATLMRQVLGHPVPVFVLNEQEWAAARDKALADISCTWDQLALMAAKADFPSGEHSKVWLALGGRTKYREWKAEQLRQEHAGCEMGECVYSPMAGSPIWTTAEGQP